MSRIGFFRFFNIFGLFCWKKGYRTRWKNSLLVYIIQYNPRGTKRTSWDFSDLNSRFDTLLIVHFRVHGLDFQTSFKHDFDIIRREHVPFSNDHDIPYLSHRFRWFYSLSIRWFPISFILSSLFESNNQRNCVAISWSSPSDSSQFRRLFLKIESQNSSRHSQSHLEFF